MEKSKKQRLVSGIIFSFFLFAFLVSILLHFNSSKGTFVFVFIVLIFWLYKNVFYPKVSTTEEAKYDAEMQHQRNVLSPYKKYLLTSFVVLLTSGIAIYVFSPENINIFFLVLFAYILSFLLYISSILRKASKQKWSEVSQELHFTFTESADASSVDELLRKIDIRSSLKSVSNILSGKLQGYPFRIYSYTYTWMKKAQNEIQVYEWTLPTTRPNMMIINKNGSFSETFLKNEVFMGTMTRLEGNFSDFFNVYVEKEAEDEVREFLNPDTMVYLLDELSEFSFLFFNNRVHIITCHTSPITVLQDYPKIKTILLKTEQSLVRM